MSASWAALLPAPPVPGLCAWLELGGRHFHSHALPKWRFGMWLWEHRLAWVSKLQAFLFLKLSYVAQLTFTQRACPAQRWAGGDGIHLGELLCRGSCRAPGVGPLPSCRAFLPAAAVKGRLCSLLVSGGFILHSRISPQMGLFCSNRLYPIQKTSGNFVFAATIPVSLGVALWD